MEKDAAKLADVIRTKYPNEEDAIILCDMIMKRLAKNTNLTKVQASGIPELIGCQTIGLKWNGKTLHGVDAVDKDGLNVELKTYKRVQNDNRVSIMYQFPPHKEKESEEVYRQRVVNHFLTSPLYQGGHYWIAFDQDKENVLRWNYVDTITVATLINDYLKRNPKSRSKNFGGTLCKDCSRCHKVDKISKLFAPKGKVQIKCDLSNVEVK